MPEAPAHPAPHRRHAPVPDDFSFTYPVQSRWVDFDALGHVNNAVYLTYVEAARLSYQRHVLGMAGLNQPWVVAEARCRYVLPIVMESAITVGLRAHRVGRSSLTFAFAIFALALEGNGELALMAEGEVVQVHVDATTGRPRPIPDAWRSLTESFERAPRHP